MKEQIGMSLWRQNEILQNSITEMMGWDAEYYLTEPDKIETLDKYELSKIVDKIKIKVLVPDDFKNTQKEIFVINIPEKNFAINKKPRLSDIIFFPDIKRMYRVTNSTLYNGLFRVELEKYTIKNTL